MPSDPYPKTKQLARGERRYRRKVASPKQWAAIRAEKLGPCRVCMAAIVEDGRGVGAIQLHHLVPRAQGGDDVADNMIPLHHFCHNGVHGRHSEALRAVAGTLTDAEYAYVIG